MPAGHLLIFLFAAAMTAILTAPVRLWLLRREMLDWPDSRRSHSRPTPRGGGAAIAGSLIAAWLVWPQAFAEWRLPMAVIFGMALTGWLEDRFSLAARWRFLAQVVAATVLAAGVGGIHSVQIGSLAIHTPWLWTPLAVVAVVWLINLHNFMDGSDGMAACQGLWSGLAMALLFQHAGYQSLAAFSLAAAGAWGGFLFWNRPPARVFMGDSGSLALGAMVAACAVVGAASGAVSIWLSFMVASVFVIDAMATLVLRAVRGQRWYTAHRQHAYQQLLECGWRHGQVAALYFLINVLVVLPTIAAALYWPQLDAVLAAGLAVLLLSGWWRVQLTATRNQRQG